VHDVDSAREAAHALRRRGVGAACIATKGGDLLVFGADEQWLPHQHVESIDATGAGDAFAAGIAVGLAENRSLGEAAWLGCAASALKTTRLGAQAGLPRRDEVDRFLATIRRDD
jgi:sugar/nucleoside kinase (ribokinase family)